MQEILVQSLDQEDPLEEGMATNSSILAWRIPWTEELGGPQSTGLQRVQHDWSNLACTHMLTWISWESWEWGEVGLRREQEWWPHPPRPPSDSSDLGSPLRVLEALEFWKPGLWRQKTEWHHVLVGGCVSLVFVDITPSQSNHLLLTLLQFTSSLDGTKPTYHVTTMIPSSYPQT